MTSRRSFLIGLGSALAAPAVIRTAGLLMPVKPMLRPWAEIPMTAKEVLLRRAKHHLMDRMVNPPLMQTFEFLGEEIAFAPYHADADVLLLREIDQQLEALRT